MLLLNKITKGSETNNTENVSLVPSPTCDYPLNIKNLFPYWTTLAPTGGDPNTDITLLDLIKEYYKWLYCNTDSITPLFGFFELEKLKDLNNSNQRFILERFIKMYIPSLDYDTFGGDASIPKLKTLLNSIKNKLYGKKGTEASFKYLISLVFGVSADDIYITYPKKYLMVLNSGSNYNIPGTEFGYKGLLNFSVIRNNSLWNEYTYIINVSGTGSRISSNAYETQIKSIIHPTGLNDLYQEQIDIFNEANETYDRRVTEIPKIGNYFDYNVENTTSTPNICAYIAYGFKQYVFPNWDKEIATKYPSGVSFGLINIGDMYFLDPKDFDVDGNPIFPNDARQSQPC